MYESYYKEVNGPSVAHEIQRFLWSPKWHYRLYKNTPLDPILWILV
jgi:hypothetical protein